MNEDTTPYFIFASLATALALVYAFKLENYLGWIDIPAHIAFGYIVTRLCKGDPLIASAVFFGWEAIEHLLSMHPNDFIHRLFYETPENKIRDIISDYIGFILARL